MSSQEERKAKTSYHTFMQHVNWLDTEHTKCDASGILSRSCYEVWSNTRRGDPSNPEDSFRRTVTAHVTGTKKRRPFPPPVEESLLEHLRMREVWPCFQDQVDSNGNPILIGKSGFRAKGFHEQAKGKESSASPASSFSDEEIEVDLRLPLPEESPEVFVEVQSDSLSDYMWSAEEDSLLHLLEQPPLMQYHSESQTDHQELVSLLLDFEEKDPGLKRSFEQEADRTEPPRRKQICRRSSTRMVLKQFEDRLEEIVKGRPDLAVVVEDNKMAWENDPELLQYLFDTFNVRSDEFVVPDGHFDLFDSATQRLALRLDAVPRTVKGSLVKLICHVMPPELIRDTLMLGANTGVPYITPSLGRGLELSQSELMEDPRLSPRFRFESADLDNYLDPREGPIGCSVIDSTNRYLSCDKTACEILRGNAVGQTTLWLTRSRLLWWINFKDIVQILFTKNEVKFQTQSFKLDGTPYVVRMHYTRVGNKVYSRFQDVSHKYPRLLHSNLPSLMDVY